MRTRVRRRVWCILLAVVMTVSLMPAQVFAARRSEIKADSGTSTWTPVAWADITADDTIAITMTEGSNTWVLPATATGGSTPPAATTGTINSSGNLETNGGAAAFGFKRSAVTGGYQLTISSGTDYLYTTATNNGTRIGKGDNGNAWNLAQVGNKSYLKATDSAGAERYLGVYNSQDWRSYKINNGALPNIGGQTVGFWKLSNGTTPPTPTYNTVAEALAGAENAQFTVKGVVTFVDDKNIYVQDSTGAICLFFDQAPTGISLGDTIVGSGTRATYKGLPELSGATFEASEGLTLSAETKTIGTLADTDLCKYIKIKNLTVTAIDGNNTTLSDDSRATITLFKAKTGETTLAVGDVIDFTGVLSTYNGYQLRNTVASEIKVHGAVTPIETGLVTDLEQLTNNSYVVIYNPGNQKAMSSYVLREDWYLRADDVTITDGEVAEPDDIVIWKVVINDDGTYTFEQGTDKALTAWLSGSYVELTSNKAHTGAATTWTLETCNEETSTFYMKNATLTLSDNKEPYIEVFTKKIDNVNQLVFLGYGIAPASLTEKEYGMQFYLVPAPALTVAAPTADPVAGEVDAGTVVTFSTTTEGATIQLNINNGEAWVEQNTFTVNEPVTIKAKAVLGDAESDVVEFVYTIREAAPVLWDRLAEAPADGSEVILVNRKNAKALTATATTDGKKLTGTDAAIADEKLTVTDDMVVLTVSAADGVYTFTSADGKFLTCPSNGSGLSFANAESDYSKWTLETQADGTWYIKSVNAVFTNNSGSKPQYLEYYNSAFTTYSLNSGGDAYKFDFYGKPEAKTGFVTDLADLTDGARVVILNKANKMALSSTYSGNYNAGVPVTVSEDDKLSGYGSTEVWTVGVATSGNTTTYTFSTADGKKLSMGTGYTSMPLDQVNNTWTVTAVPDTDDLFYIDNVGRSGYRIEWYASKSYWSAYNNNNTGDLFRQQFYLVGDEQPAQPAGLPQAGDEVVIYNATAEGVIGLGEPNQTATLSRVHAEIEGSYAVPENGAYVFTVGVENGNYTFEAGGKYLATNNAENLFMSDELLDTGDNCGYWTLEEKGDGYLIKSKTARYNNSGVVCIEFFSDAFSGWTFKAADAAIFIFNFYPVAENVAVIDGVAQAPTVIFDCQDSRYIEQDFPVKVTLDDLAETITNIDITYSYANSTNVLTPDDYEVDETGKVYTFTIPASELDSQGVIQSFTITVQVSNSNELSYQGVKTVTVVDEPFIGALTPAANAQTLEDKQPVISAEIGNVGEDPEFTMTINEEEVDAVYEDGVLSYQSDTPMEDGRYSVTVRVVRADQRSAEKTWSFYVGEAQYQLYFGQLHSHTAEYSDGAGTLQNALDHIAGLADSANIQFVAFTDHSNYFDDKNAANPEGALYDMTLGTPASQTKWSTYTTTIRAFNETHSNLVAIPGFEMTWSGGPGHINTFNTPGIVSRNNTTLNNKTNDAGMKAYYALLSQAEGVDSISQFNHPGKTFGTFADFSYWDPVADSRIYLVEVGNGEGAIGSSGYFPSYSEYIKALDKGWHLAPTNNQDNHKGKWGNANDARDVVYTDDFSEEGIYNAIRQLRVYATEDKNLEIRYTVNDEPMGTIFTEVPEKLNVSVSVFDPDSSDSIVKVELVANSGAVAYTWDDPMELSQGLLEAEIDPTYTYYFVRVTEGDKDLAVTAPVWIGESLKLGINSLECSVAYPVTDEEFTLTTTLFNSEAQAAAIKSVTYTTNGSVVLSTESDAGEVPAGGTKELTFAYTPDKAKMMDITVTVVLELDGVEYTFTKDITLEIQDADALVYIGIDASHYNEYVSGNYKDSMGNFGQLAAGYGVRTVELNTSEDLIAACSNEKYKALIFTAPSRRLPAAQSDPGTYSEEELAAITAFNEAGGLVIVSGWGDAYENYDAILNNPDILHMAATQNELLTALGSSIRLGDDEVVDPQLNGGQEQRLYLSTYNFDSYLLEGVEFDADHPNDRLYTEVYSNYGGCSVYFTDTQAVPATVTPVVFGHTTTNIDNKDGDNNPQGVKYVYEDNDLRVVVMATEELEGKGGIIVSGAAFMSNFEVQATVEDTAAEKNYSNYKICENLVKGFNELAVTPIEEVQAQTEAGLIYVIEGTVTSNASGYDKDTAFFDCIYIQDETAGICCFPVAGDFKIGDTVRIKGYTDFYQGEMELQVMTIEKTGETDPVEPADATAAQINDLSLLGSLVRLEGTVKSFEYENGLVQTILVKDSRGNVARVFIDGYITKDKDVEGLEVGANIVAVGLSSYDDTWPDENYFPRIRVRDRDDIVCTPGNDNPHTPHTPKDKFPFVDVPEDAYFRKAVEWAVKNGVTAGTTPTTFSPYDPCTRGQVVTFLWIASGKPEPASTECPFTDVAESDYFYKPVLWAYENGITAGVSADKFGPEQTVTRAQVATFLYGIAGRPAAGEEPFTDVSDGDWFAAPVAWAYNEGITAGTTATTFGPGEDCLRGQIVTFLYLYYGK